MEDEQTEIQAETAPERPDWLPSKFDKPEDLANSYLHADKKITEQGQELAALRNQIEEIQAYQSQAQSQQYTDDYAQQAYDAFESGDGRSMAGMTAALIKSATDQLRAELAATQPAPQSLPLELTADYAERVVQAKYSDWPEYAAKAKEIIHNDDYLRNSIQAGFSEPGRVAATLETAYKLAKFDAGQTASAAAADTLDELNRATKNAAQTMSGTNASSEAESYWDLVKRVGSGDVPRFNP